MTERNCSGVSRVAGHGRADAGVVDEHVDPAELRHRLVDQALALLGVGHVGRDRVHAAAGRAHRVGDALELLDPAGAEHDVGAGLGEAVGERDAQPARGTGDDDDLVVEAEEVHDGSCRGP